MVVTITTPVLVLGLVVGYLAINSVINGINDLFNKEKKSEEKDK